MPNTFLQRLAKHLIQTHKDLENLTVVFPNKRAGLFFQKYLAEYIDKPIWSPSILSMEAFVSKHVQMTIADNLTLLAELYQIYRQTNQASESFRNFEDFFTWGNILLQDFNEIDLYLIDNHYLFSYLKEAKEKDIWMPNESLTDIQKKYLNFWGQFNGYYLQLKQQLKAKNIAYRGMLFKQLYENIKYGSFEFPPSQFFIFAGFNALTPVERYIIDNLLKQNKASIFWNADKHYLDNKHHEAGKYLRQNLHQYFPQKEPLWIDNNFATQEKNIQMLGVPQNIGQIKKVADILLQPQFQQAGTETAIVLADEQLLAPLLNAIPTHLKVNVTMGYPIKLTHIADWCNQIMELQTILPTEQSPSKDIPLKILKSVVLNHYFLQLPTQNPNLFEQHNDWFQLNQIFEPFGQKEFINTNTLLRIFSETALSNVWLPKILTNYHQNPLLFLDILEEIISQLKPDDDIEQAAIAKIINTFSKIRNLDIQLQMIDSVKTLQKLFKEIIKKESISFAGEPLEGLQIMGMLETRNLDFENVIILSANEGTLPREKSQESFVPYDIRKDVGLPVYTDKDAIFSYNFYRLLQQAKNIYLIYNNQPDEQDAKEKSRFLLQIQHELSPYPNIHISDTHLNPTAIAIQPHTKKIITKTPEILELVKDKILAKGKNISTTLISTYIACPLNFFYKYVLNFKEEEKTEILPANNFGSIIHNVLEEFYKPFLYQPLQAELLEKKLTEKELINDLIRQAFEKETDYNILDISTGILHLYFEIIKELVIDFIQKDVQNIKENKQNNLPHKIVGLEKNILFDLDLKAYNTKYIQEYAQSISIKAKIDRIDEINGTIRILDYKTGRFNKNDINIDTLDDFLLPEKEKAFQLMFYKMLLTRDYNNNKIDAGIYSFKSRQHFFNKLNVDENIETKDFAQVFVNVLDEIFDPNMPFEHKHNAPYCEFCE